MAAPAGTAARRPARAATLGQVAETRPPGLPSSGSPKPVETKPPAPPPPADGALSVEVVQRVKSATVKVQAGNESAATGSGFFEQSTGLILTNAHVVGMSREGAPSPRKLEVTLNSGAEGETSLPAQLVSVDRENNLAMLRVQLSSAQKVAIAFLTLAPARDLQEKQPLHVAGFPSATRAIAVSPSFPRLSPVCSAVRTAR